MDAVFNIHYKGAFRNLANYLIVRITYFDFRMVFHFERLFRRSHPNIPNPARYQQIRRGESVYSQSSIFEEVSHNNQLQPQQHKQQPQQHQQKQQYQQQQQHQTPALITHSNIVEVHQNDDQIVNSFP